MIFEYDELKGCVKEDFERFYEMGFDEKQIFPAVLNEYEHGEDFSQVENICIHLFLVLDYAEKELDFNEIIEKLKQLITKETDKKVKDELENEYTKYISDLDIIMDIVSRY